MKALVSVAASGIFALSAFGQGVVLFANLDRTVTPNILAIVTDASDGHPLAGTEAHAALLGGPAETGISYAFTREAAYPVGYYYWPSQSGNLYTLPDSGGGSSFVDFRTGNAAGYILPTPRIIPGVNVGSRAMLQMVVWTGDYTDWYTALRASDTDYNVKVGCSAPWIVTTQDPTNPVFPHNIGLEPFSVESVWVPEPSGLVLLGFGVALALRSCRRR